MSAVPHFVDNVRSPRSTRSDGPFHGWTWLLASDLSLWIAIMERLGPRNWGKIVEEDYLENVARAYLAGFPFL